MGRKGLSIVGLLAILAGLNGGASAADPIRWVYTEYPPANFQTESGEHSGYLHDIVVEAIQQRMGIPVSISVFPWKRCQILVKEGQADMLVTVPTADRLEYTATCGQPVWIKRTAVFTYPGHPRIRAMDAIRGLDDIKRGGFRVLSYIGNSSAKQKLESAGIPIEYASSVESMFRMLAHRRGGDIVLEDLNLANLKIDELDLKDGIVLTKGVGDDTEFHILVGKKSGYVNILPQLDSILQEMWRDGTIQRILTSYNQRQDATPASSHRPQQRTDLGAGAAAAEHGSSGPNRP